MAGISVANIHTFTNKTLPQLLERCRIKSMRLIPETSIVMNDAKRGNYINMKGVLEDAGGKTFNCEYTTHSIGNNLTQNVYVPETGFRVQQQLRNVANKVDDTSIIEDIFITNLPTSDKRAHVGYHGVAKISRTGNISGYDGTYYVSNPGFNREKLPYEFQIKIKQAKNGEVTRKASFIDPDYKRPEVPKDGKFAKYFDELYFKGPPRLEIDI